MTKKTIMEQLTEADEKTDIKGRYYMDSLFSQAMDDANELHFESIEQHVAVHALDALERIANALESNANQTQAKSNQTQIKGNITYSEFFEEFNKIQRGYHTCASDRDGAVIVDDEGNLKANLGANSGVWTLNVSGFSSDELALMAKLAATSPELRGGNNNDKMD